MGTVGDVAEGSVDIAKSATSGVAGLAGEAVEAVSDIAGSSVDAFKDVVSGADKAGWRRSRECDRGWRNGIGGARKARKPARAG